MMKPLGPLVFAFLLVACAEESNRLDADTNADSGLDLEDGTDGEVGPDAEDGAEDGEVGDVGDTTCPVFPELQPADRHEERAAASGPLFVGVAHLPLDPPVGVSMGGFGNRTGPTDSPWADMFFASVGSHGHLWVKAIVFEVAGERMALLKVPLPFSEDSLTHSMLDVLESRYGLDLRGRVITAATHSHAGPARFWQLPSPLGIAGIDNPDDEIILRFGERMAEVVAMAIEDLAPAEWGFAVRENWDPEDRVYRDRRGANNPRWGKDPRLTVLGVRRDGEPLVVMANFAMHGTILGSDNRLLSDDAGGGFEVELERELFERFGVPAMGVFTQAGGGDAAPAGDRLGHRGEQRIQMVGVEGAGVVVDLFEGMAWESSAELAVRSRLVGLQHGWIYGDSGEFDSATGPILGSLQCDIDPAAGRSQEGGPKECIELAGVFELLDLSLPHPELNQTYLTVARLGPLAMVTVPGEPTHSIVEYARQQVEALGVTALVVGYSQDHLLYFTHPDDWYAGDYEAEFSVWGPWAGVHLVERQVDVLRAMLAGDNGPTYYEEVGDLSPPLSTVRRPLERSVAAGVLRRSPGEVKRLEVFEVEVGGGDPALGLPEFVLEAEVDGSFLPVEVAGRPLDMGRLDGVTLYRPLPDNGPDVLAERDHRWVWRFQIPPDMPAGRYRVSMTGLAVMSAGALPARWSAVSEVFSVVQDPAATLEVAALGGARFSVRLTHPPAPLVTAEGQPLSGFRVFAPSVGPGSRIAVREVLKVVVERGAERLEVVLAPDEALDLSGSALAVGAGITVSAHLASDRIPSPVSAPRP